MDDRECDADELNCTLFFVVVDLATGEEIARTEVAGTIASIAHIFVGEEEVFYISSEAGKPHGFITRISVETYQGAKER